jgi:hypothetical protein
MCTSAASSKVWCGGGVGCVEKFRERENGVCRYFMRYARGARSDVKHRSYQTGTEYLGKQELPYSVKILGHILFCSQL